MYCQLDFSMLDGIHVHLQPKLTSGGGGICMGLMARRKKPPLG